MIEQFAADGPCIGLAAEPEAVSERDDVAIVIIVGKATVYISWH
jgi:hypothetical protein